MVLKRVSATMMNGQAAFLSAIHHHAHHPPAYAQQHFAIGDIGPSAASGGQASHHLHHHQQHLASSSASNLALVSAHQAPSFVDQAGAACGTPAGLFHPLPLPFRPPRAADLPANYNTAGQAVAHQHQFVRPAILTPQRMAAYSAQQQGDELARLQELSNKWEPEATGPLVSELLDSSAITTEYANADPQYQIKTAALPQSFAHYRTCRGDGHCGWRAVAFCYFEALVRTADAYKFEEEVARLKSLRNIMNEAGFAEDLYIDFADEAWNLLRELGPLPVDVGMATLLQAFNDEGVAMAMITYFKLLTSAYIRKNPDNYEPYMMGLPVAQYLQARIEPSNCEMEEVGLSAMLAVLVSPAGLAAEVHYLDRSVGDTPNVIEYGWTGGETAIAKIRLLYRPGHYDILYKAEDLATRKASISNAAQQAHQQDVMVNIQHNSTEHFHHSTGGFRPDVIEIPGLSLWNGAQAGWPQSINTGYDLSPTSMSPAIASPRTAVTPTYPGVSTAVVPNMYFQSTPMPQHAIHQQMALPHHPHIDRGTPFRPSAWEYTLDMNHAPHQSLCQTAIFRNSHYNTAHFNNPDFEPEQWHPENDYATTDRPRKKSSHSHSS